MSLQEEKVYARNKDCPEAIKCPESSCRPGHHGNLAAELIALVGLSFAMHSISGAWIL